MSNLRFVADHMEPPFFPHELNGLLPGIVLEPAWVPELNRERKLAHPLTDGPEPADTIQCTIEPGRKLKEYGIQLACFHHRIDRSNKSFKHFPRARKVLVLPARMACHPLISLNKESEILRGYIYPPLEIGLRLYGIEGAIHLDHGEVLPIDP
ncbi:hypothetical protein D3C81_1579820 [compost metagenome]